MPLPIEPKVPTTPTPLRADAILDIQRRASFWARLSVFASVAVAGGAVVLTWRGGMAWPWAVVAGLLPLLPISAQTRIDELRRKLLDQLRDTANEQARERATKRSG